MTGRVLVTGAGGFIGRWSVRPLLERGFEVHAVLRPGSVAPVEVQGAHLLHADLLEPSTAASLVAAVRPSHWLHFAWIATPGIYWHSPDNARWLEASLRLLDAFRAAGGRRVVMSGSCAEYDWSRVGECDERTSPLADPGRAPPYVSGKLALQRALAEAGERHGLSTAWGRIFFQYGPFEPPERLVASVIRRLLAGEDAPVTHGTQVRSFLHVADVGDAFAALLGSQLEGPVNVGSAERTTLAALLRQIETRIGGPGRLRLGAREAPPGEPTLLVPLTRRLDEELGWRPRYTLATGLAQTIEWWREATAVAGQGRLT